MENENNKNRRKVIGARIASFALAGVLIASPLFMHKEKTQAGTTEDTTLSTVTTQESIIEEETPIIIEEEKNENIIRIPTDVIYIEPTMLDYCEEKEGYILTDKDSLNKYEGYIMISLGKMNINVEDYSYLKYLTNAGWIDVQYQIDSDESLERKSILEGLVKVDNLNLIINSTSTLTTSKLESFIDEVDKNYPLLMTFNILASSIEDINCYTEYLNNYQKSEDSMITYDIIICENFDLSDINLSPNIDYVRVSFVQNQEFEIGRISFQFIENLPNTNIDLGLNFPNIIYNEENIRKFMSGGTVFIYGDEIDEMISLDELTLDSKMISLDLSKFNYIRDLEDKYILRIDELKNYTGNVIINGEYLDTIIYKDLFKYFEKSSIIVESNLRDYESYYLLEYLKEVNNIKEIIIGISSQTSIAEEDFLTLVESLREKSSITLALSLELDELETLDYHNNIYGMIDGTKINYELELTPNMDVSQLHFADNTKRVQIYNTSIEDLAITSSYATMIKNNPGIMFNIDNQYDNMSIDLSSLSEGEQKHVRVSMFGIYFDHTKFKGEIFSLHPIDVQLDVSKLKNYQEVNGCIITDAESLKAYDGTVEIKLGNMFINNYQYEYLNYFNENTKINVGYNLYSKTMYANAANLNNLSHINSFEISLDPFDKEVNDEETIGFIKELNQKYDLKIRYITEISDEYSYTRYLEISESFKKEINAPVIEDLKITGDFAIENLKIADNVEEIAISFGTEMNYHLNEDSFSFLVNHNDKKITLNINNYYVDYDLANLSKYDFKNLHLIFDLTANFDMDFDKISDIKGLKSIEFLCSGANDLSIYLEQDILTKLNEKGIKITYNGMDNFTTINEANDKLDDIVDELNVNDTSTEIEKFNAILAYILSNYRYDDIIARNNENTLPEYNQLVSDKYVGGSLTPVFNDAEGDIICGNYSALFEALANRVGLNSMIISANVHSWNIVKLGDDYYHVDSCWLDGENDFYTIELLKDNDITELDNVFWYRYLIEEEVNMYIDPTHTLPVMPVEIDMDFLEYEDPYLYQYIETGITDSLKASDITNQVYKVKVDNETYYVPSYIMMGIIIGMGCAIKITNSVKKEENKRRKH